MHKLKLLTVLISSLLVNQLVYSQNDMNLLDAVDETKEKKVVTATFKTTKLVNIQTVEQVKRGELDFRISHRFDDIAGASGGVKTLYGLDNVTDIRISFDYGITDWLCVGFARSKGAFQHRQLLDFSTKAKLIQQKENGFPFGISFFAASTITTMSSSTVKSDVTYFGNKFTHRMTHSFQLLFAKKVNSKFSFQILPTYVHRNLVDYTQNNGTFALGAGARLKFTKRMGVIVDYYQVFDKTLSTANGFYAPLGVGLELETGGHVFHLLFSNNKSLVESQYITSTKDNWLKGQFRFGFNISRIFNIVQ